MREEIDMHSYLSNIVEDNICNIKEVLDKLKTGVDKDIDASTTSMSRNNQCSISSTENGSSFNHVNESTDPRYYNIITGYDNIFNKKVKHWIKDLIRKISYKEQMIDHYSHKSLFIKEKKNRKRVKNFNIK